MSGNGVENVFLFFSPSEKKLLLLHINRVLIGQKINVVCLISAVFLQFKLVQILFKFNTMDIF